MNKIELMQKEIEDKRKLPEELKKEIKKNILHNLLVAVIIVVYIWIINILFYKLEKNIFEQQMKFFALGIITVTAIVFELAYRRQSKRMCVIGIELLLCSIISLYIPYIYLFANVNLKMITLILPISIAAYYIFKAFLIYKTGEIKHHNNLSDVKEILKDTEKQSYIDEDSKKSYREIKAYEEKAKKELIEEQHKKAKANKENKKASKSRKITESTAKSEIKTKTKSKTSEVAKKRKVNENTTEKKKTKSTTTKKKK